MMSSRCLFLGVEVLASRIEGEGCRGLGFGSLCVGSKVQGSSFGVWGSDWSKWCCDVTSSACMRLGFCVSGAFLENIEVSKGAGVQCFAFRGYASKILRFLKGLVSSVLRFGGMRRKY
jgi:hypothetical protein